MATLRNWQVAGLEAFAASGLEDFLVAATPGAGKTTFALTSAKMMHRLRGIQYVIIVVHTNAIRQQWCASAAQHGLQLLPLREPEDLARIGYHGCVVTYQQLASSQLRLVREAVQKRRTMMIADEIHHAGDNKTWGDALQQAFGDCPLRLLLTGTPWRRNAQERIPFVTYDASGKVVVNFSYGYSEALRDGVCRPIRLMAYTGDVSWSDDGRLVHSRLSEYLPTGDVSVALASAFSPTNTWIATLLEEANGKLTELRRTVPDAGGLVVAGRQDLARKYAAILHEMTGQRPAVVLSDDGVEAKQALDKFRKGTTRWLCAVNMISEGVDVPRLCVGVFATNIKTPLFFRQVVGRFVRKRAGEHVTAELLYPQVQPLVRHAEEIETEIRHVLEEEGEEGEAPPEEEEGFGEPRKASRKVAAEAGAPVLGRVIVSGDKSWVVPDEVAVVPEEVAIPRYVEQEQLRAQVDKLVKRCAARMNGQLSDNIQRLNRALRTRYGPRPSASNSTLQRMVEDLSARL